MNFHYVLIAFHQLHLLNATGDDHRAVRPDGAAALRGRAGAAHHARHARAGEQP